MAVWSQSCGLAFVASTVLRLSGGLAVLGAVLFWLDVPGEVPCLDFAMPKSIGFDMHTMLDAVDAERRSRSCSSVRVYRPGMEPLDWHLLPENLPRSASVPVGDQRAWESGRDRSRSPWRSAFVCDGSAVTGSGAVGICLEDWNWHFDGVVRPFRHGFVLGVDDALVDGHNLRRSIFVAAFADTVTGFRGDEILSHCLEMHVGGDRWADVEGRCCASCQIARAALRECEAGWL